MKKAPPLVLLAFMALFTSCSHQGGLQKVRLAQWDFHKLNPFWDRIPLIQVDESDTAKLQDLTLASHQTQGIPHHALGPIDALPSELPGGLDLLQAGLLPPKSAGSSPIIETGKELAPHTPIIPRELLDADSQDASDEALTEFTDEAPLVPNAPTIASLKTFIKPTVSSTESPPSLLLTPLPPSTQTKVSPLLQIPVKKDGLKLLGIPKDQ